MQTNNAVLKAAEHLNQHGYVVLEDVLTQAMVERWREVLDVLLTQEQDSPFDPGDGPSHPEDNEIETAMIPDAECRVIPSDFGHAAGGGGAATGGGCGGERSETWWRHTAVHCLREGRHRVRAAAPR